MLYEPGFEKKLAPYVPIPKGWLKVLLLLFAFANTVGILSYAAFTFLPLPKTENELGQIIPVLFCAFVCLIIMRYAGVLRWLDEYHSRNIRGYTALFYWVRNTIEGVGCKAIHFHVCPRGTREIPDDMPKEYASGLLVPIHLGGWGLSRSERALWLQGNNEFARGQTHVNVQLVRGHSPFTVQAFLDSEEPFWFQPANTIRVSLAWLMEILDSPWGSEKIRELIMTDWGGYLWTACSDLTTANDQIAAQNEEIAARKADTQKFLTLRAILLEVAEEIDRTSRLKASKEGNRIALALLNRFLGVLPEDDLDRARLEDLKRNLVALTPAE